MAFKVEGEARVAFVNEPGVLPTNPPDNGELKVQQADGLLVTRRQDGSARFTDLRPMSEQLASGPLADAFASVPRTGHVLVNDTDYQCLSTDVQVGVKPLTAPRTIRLPDVDSYPFYDLVIADESGSCSDTKTITILPGLGTGDIIGTSEGSVILFTAYQYARFRRGASNLWIRM